VVRGEVVARFGGSSAGIATAKGSVVARPRSRADSRPRAVEADAFRFAAGWRLLGGGAEAEGEGAGAAEPSLRFDVIRAADLVALSVQAEGCELVAGGDSPPVLRPIQGKEARLVVTFPHQHLAEDGGVRRQGGRGRADPVKVPVTTSATAALRKRRRTAQDQPRRCTVTPARRVVRPVAFEPTRDRGARRKARRIEVL
jgi:hypothetical protein